MVSCLTIGQVVLSNSQVIAKTKSEQPLKQNVESTDFSGLPIVLAARFKIKPPQREEFLRLARIALRETVKEPGVITYNLYEEESVKNSFIFFEEWKSRQALDVHLKTDYTKNLLDRFSDLVDGEPSIKVYSIQGVNFILGM